MSALPSDGAVRAAVRWWQLLGRSALPQAWAIIRADAAYADLTPTQYVAALEWLKDTGGLVKDPPGLTLNPQMRTLPHRQVMRLLFQRGIEEAQPAWLADADVLVPDPTELPQDASDLAECLGISPGDAFLAVSQAQRKVDLERRAAVGAAGERLLVQRLKAHWSGRTSHVSLEYDGLGFDLVLADGIDEWHVEVKTTTRRGRLVIYLSRNEYEVSLVDPDWRLVITALDEQEELAAVATVRGEVVGARMPKDQHWTGRWESVRLGLMPEDLELGLPFLERRQPPMEAMLAGFLGQASDRFSWLPVQR